jgi:hypothetical protein
MVGQRNSLSGLATLLLALLCAVAMLQRAHAQQDENDIPLGDLARTLRSKKVPPADVIVDNDNLSEVMADAEKKKTKGTNMVFSFDPGGKQIQVSSPDVSCNLSFSAKSTALLADPAIIDELPRSELAKLDGPATLDGDSLQIAVHNGTSWELREVLIGLTILRSSEGSSASRMSPSYGAAHITPAVGGPSAAASEPTQKQPDITVLLKVKGSAAPSATALFRTQLNFALFPDQEWHWAIVRAKGVPPTNLAEESAVRAADAGKQ